MKSLHGLKYLAIDLNNLNKAYKIQKETWPDDSYYDDLYDKAVNKKDDNCFFLIYNNETLIGITGVNVFEEYPDTIWLDWFTIFT